MSWITRVDDFLVFMGLAAIIAGGMWLAALVLERRHKRNKEQPN
jgi:hypothetical protein